MPKKVFLKPNPNNKVEGNPVKVYDPVHRDFMPADGRAVILNPYWLHRLRNGEVLRQGAAARQTDAEIVDALKNKKDVIAFATEKFGEEFAETLPKDAKLPELKDAVLAQLNK